MRNQLAELQADGFTVVRSIGHDLTSATAALEELMSSFATPLHVFKRHPFWKPIGVNGDRPPGRSEGTGLNSLHIDCVTSQLPPRYVVMLCIRPDPNGGGASVLARWDEALLLTSKESLRTLSHAQVLAEPTYDLEGVGPGLTSYTVIGTGDYPRYSGRYLDDYDLSDAERVALLELDRTLHSVADVVELRALDALVVDQQRVLHGRLSLRRNEDGTFSNDRLLVQAFFAHTEVQTT